MLVHYATVVHYFRRDISWVVAAPPITGPISPVALWVYPPWLDLGKFGVGTFFLISGFVIPFSLRRSGAGAFLLARALRIYPTFWAALLIEAATILASGRYWHRPPAYGIGAYLVNGLLIETPLGRPTVDWVSWTLSIEVKFYLLAAILRTTLLRGRVWPLLTVAAGALLLNLLQARGAIRLPPDLVSEAMYLGFIPIGTLFHHHHEGTVSAPGAGGRHAGAARPVLRELCNRARRRRLPVAAHRELRDRGRGVRRLLRPAPALPSQPRPRCAGGDQLPALPGPCRRRLHRHQLPDAGCGLPYGLAAILAALLATALAATLHRLVERPTVRLGHRLRRRMRSPAALVSGTAKNKACPMYGRAADDMEEDLFESPVRRTTKSRHVTRL